MIRSFLLLQLLLLLLPERLFAGAGDSTEAQKRRAARRSTLVVRYDFKTGRQVMPREYPWIHQPVVYRLENINRLAYDIKVESRDSIIAENESVAGAAVPIPEVRASDVENELASIKEDVTLVRSAVLSEKERADRLSGNCDREETGRDPRGHTAKTVCKSFGNQSGTGWSENCDR